MIVCRVLTGIMRRRKRICDFARMLMLFLSMKGWSTFQKTFNPAEHLRLNAGVTSADTLACWLIWFGVH